MVFDRNYLMNLRTSRPPPTSSAPAPSPSSEALLAPPVGGSALGGAPGAGAAPILGGGGGGGGGGGDVTQLPFVCPFLFVGHVPVLELDVQESVDAVIVDVGESLPPPS